MNGSLQKRVSKTIEELQDKNNVPQSAVNLLMLELMTGNTDAITCLDEKVTKHLEEHSELTLAQIEAKHCEDEINDEINRRLEKIEKVVFFPVKNPGKFGSIVFSILIVLSAWFLSGTRLLILEAMNAPDWLINFLNPPGLPYP